MSTTGHENHRLPRIFKDRRERTGHHKKRGALPDVGPYLQASCFQGVSPLKRKENSSQCPRRRLRVRLRCRTSRPELAGPALSVFRFGNINPIPFR